MLKPRKGAQIVVRMEESDAQWLKERAVKQGVSYSLVVRELVAKAMAEAREA